MNEEQNTTKDSAKTVPATPSPVVENPKPTTSKKRKIILLVVGALVVLAAMVFTLLQLGKEG
jgi:hypothetical protein